MAGSLAYNKKVSFDYEILEKYEAGIELVGIEVKSIRHNHAVLLGAHISIRGGEAFLINADIAPYQPNNTPKDYDSKRTRKLILNKKQIAELAALEAKKGLTIVPISMYNSRSRIAAETKKGKASRGGKIKVEIAVVRGKKQFDKRQSIKKRDTEREIRREFSDR
ncbi:MAG: SsrA-binding protein SsrA-binding protein [Candidatus Taylorbacteria bacterium]|nr:SsrA-binding protein SsrA-binding protein [Candidatus Taylorbacteria bacterium]